ncbi:MAG TPA: glutamate--cysteine ligase [Pseudonocardiaceae bacterium]|nr:glutamate--cysteine ligase [Pseudonocardiaceae bacterium]
MEEEFFAVDSGTRLLLTDTRPLLGSAQAREADHKNPSYSDELRPCMIESRTGICHNLDQVRAELRDLRGGLVQAARETGGRIVSAGAFPLADWRTQGFVPTPRFERIAKIYAQLAGEHVVCACHVHVGVEDRDTAIQVMNRVRPWLPVLSALSSSSPFWMGEDTGYASYRSIIWERWPMAGIPPTFLSFDHYTKAVQSLIDTETTVGTGQIYWDIRPGTRYKTVEFRIADACATIDETLVQAGLSRALAQKCLNEIERGNPSLEIRPELLRAAKWRSARFGLTGSLLDPISVELVPAHSLVDLLFEYVRSPLEEAGDWDEMTNLVERIKRDGSSAERQREVFFETNRLADVVDLLVSEAATL